MNLPTITEDPKVARQAFLEYRREVKLRSDEEDAALMRGYQALAKGNVLLNLDQVFTNPDYIDELGRPTLAVARSDIKHIKVELGSQGCYFYWSHHWNGRNVQATRSQLFVPLPMDSQRRTRNNHNDLRAPVPPVPPRLRPRHHLRNYWTLWEVEEWETFPADPLLLKRIDGLLFAVLAQWDLTPLERSLLGSIRRLQ